MPVVRTSDNNGIHIRSRYQLLISPVTFRSRPELTAATLTMDIGTGQYSGLTIYIKYITNRGYLNIQIILLHILLITRILLIQLISLFHLIDPRRLSETCGTHQLLSTNTEADQTDTDLLAIALRLQIGGLSVTYLKYI